MAKRGDRLFFPFAECLPCAPASSIRVHTEEEAEGVRQGRMDQADTQNERLVFRRESAGVRSTTSVKEGLTMRAMRSGRQGTRSRGQSKVGG